MKIISKLTKGFVVIFSFNFLIGISMILFDSCKKSEFTSHDSTAKSEFLSALNNNKKKIGSIFVRGGDSQTSLFSTSIEYTQSSNYESIYLDYPVNTPDETKNLIYTTNSIQELSDLIDYSNAIIQYDPTISNSNYQLQVQIDTVIKSLNPLISEAKQYLYRKGFTRQDIQDMLIEENGKEEDLIPFVMALTQAENAPSVAKTKNYTSYFFNSAYARLDANDYIRCTIVALGIDVVWSLGMSSASAWTVPAMKKAFRAVAKRALGPIGVAIAVVSFGTCIAEAYFE